MALQLLVAVAIVLSLAFAMRSEWGKLPAIQWRLRPGWLVLSLLALIAFEALHIELWRGMLRNMGGRLPRWKGRSIWATTLLARYVPTSVLMAVGRVALAEKEGVPRRMGLASVVYEVALTFTASVAISTYLVLTLPAFEHHASRWIVIAIPLAGLLALHPRIFGGVANTILRRIGSETLPLALPFGTVLRFFVLFVGSFLVAGFGVLAMTHALAPVRGGGEAALVAAYSLGFAAGVIGFVLPGALGAREAGVAIAVATVVASPVALAVALVLRFVQIGVELLYAAVMPVIARRTGA
jgi:hypothetical protein